MPTRVVLREPRAPPPPRGSSPPPPRGGGRRRRIDEHDANGGEGGDDAVGDVVRRRRGSSSSSSSSPSPPPRRGRDDDDGRRRRRRGSLPGLGGRRKRRLDDDGGGRARASPSPSPAPPPPPPPLRRRTDPDSLSRDDISASPRLVGYMYMFTAGLVCTISAVMFHKKLIPGVEVTNRRYLVLGGRGYGTADWEERWRRTQEEEEGVPSDWPSPMPSSRPSSSRPPSLLPSSSMRPSSSPMPSYPPTASQAPSRTPTPTPTPTPPPTPPPTRLPSPPPSPVPSPYPTISTVPTVSLQPSVRPSVSHRPSASLSPSAPPSSSFDPSVRPSPPPSAEPSGSGSPTVTDAANPSGIPSVEARNGTAAPDPPLGGAAAGGDDANATGVDATSAPSPPPAPTASPVPTAPPSITVSPSSDPTVTLYPSHRPTAPPSSSPTDYDPLRTRAPIAPSSSPSSYPSRSPTLAPTVSARPSSLPSTSPTAEPTILLDFGTGTIPLNSVLEWKVWWAIYLPAAACVLSGAIVSVHFDKTCFPNLWRSIFRDGSIGELSLLLFLAVLWGAALYVCTSANSVGSMQPNVFFSVWVGFLSTFITYGMWRTGADEPSFVDILRHHPRQTTYNWACASLCSFVTLVTLVNLYYERKLVGSIFGLRKAKFTAEQWRRAILIPGLTTVACVAAPLMSHWMSHPGVGGWARLLWRRAEGIVVLGLMGVWSWVLLEYTGVNGLVNGVNNMYMGVWGTFLSVVLTFGSWLKDNKDMTFATGIMRMGSARRMETDTETDDRDGRPGGGGG